jgi:Protein of unknown function (DUF2568)
VTETRLSPVETVTLVLRVLMEAGIVVGLAYWGAHAGDTTAGRIVLGILAPLVGFGLWGAVDFRQAGRLAEPLRLLQELVISGLAAIALYAAGQHALGVALAALSVGYHALVYLAGGRLLQQPADAR